MYKEAGVDPLANPGEKMDREIAAKLSQAWIQANFELAQRALSNVSGRGHALVYFAYAAHTLQDSTSPVHHGFQPWGIEGSQSLPSHILGESYNPGKGSNLYKATRDIYQWFFNDQRLPNGNLFSRYGADYRIDPAPKVPPLPPTSSPFPRI